MIRIKKITNKEKIVVESQSKHCTCGSNGQPQNYGPVNKDCLFDCSNNTKPLYYQSSCV